VVNKDVQSCSELVEQCRRVGQDVLEIWTFLCAKRRESARGLLRLWTLSYASRLQRLKLTSTQLLCRLKDALFGGNDAAHELDTQSFSAWRAHSWSARRSRFPKPGRRL
jgi:hypothetical protein